nr:hypothetical protein CFP56_11622 [Quercus suber]
MALMAAIGTNSACSSKPKQTCLEVAGQLGGGGRCWEGNSTGCLYIPAVFTRKRMLVVEMPDLAAAWGKRRAVGAERWKGRRIRGQGVEIAAMRRHIDARKSYERGREGQWKQKYGRASERQCRVGGREVVAAARANEKAQVAARESCRPISSPQSVATKAPHGREIRRNARDRRQLCNAAARLHRLRSMIFSRGDTGSGGEAGSRGNTPARESPGVRSTASGWWMWAADQFTFAK